MLTFGTDSVSLVGVIRNIGNGPLPEGRAVGRLICTTGLDYLEGDTYAKLPAMEPNATVMLRWRVQPTNPDGPLVATFAIDEAGTISDVKLLALQHLAEQPSADSSSISKIAVARAGRGDPVIENSRLRIRIVSNGVGAPILLLSTRIGSGWKFTASSFPLAETFTAEGGERPWWEIFRYESVQAVNGKGVASLILTGGIGLRWRATLAFSLRDNSRAIDARLSLSPLKPVKLSGIRMLPLYAGSMSLPLSVDEVLPPDTDSRQLRMAVRMGETTVGLVWPGDPLYADWQTTALPNVDGADYRLMAYETKTTAAPVDMTPGVLTTARASLFAIAPSASVNDANSVLSPGIDTTPDIKAKSR